ncbi:DMT family transporter [Methylomonas sp. SURF-1]|uniref:DMT family transporter n=1 Tax=Methylomonas aurea TaxID=2952224 RepID=A0ABT1ULC8_9GAMM|nr:DMT family transporter [Methylomonas sp. SURF-1]MCQ8183030.1 DMT family transporter [Methylomonas sp. SURF-1]
MAIADALRLLLLSAIWGGSFLLMRIAAPILGVAYVAEGRVLSASLFLFLLALFRKRLGGLLCNWRYLLVMGFFNVALPFSLFAYAAAVLSTSQLSVLNATAPIWAYAIGLTLGIETFDIKRLCGMVTALCGVVLLFWGLLVATPDQFLLPVISSLCAAFSYGIATNYAKAKATLAPFETAHGSLWAASLLLVPMLFLWPARQMPTAESLLAVAGLGVVCTGVAFPLYYRLIRDIGASSALTVTFLNPVFATLWGALYLAEAVVPRHMFGMAVILVGTALSTGFRVGNLRKRRKPA